MSSRCYSSPTQNDILCQLRDRYLQIVLRKANLMMPFCGTGKRLPLRFSPPANNFLYCIYLYENLFIFAELMSV